ncbi:MAG: hypothetical protein ACRC2Y_04890 [Aeromonas veronii]
MKHLIYLSIIGALACLAYQQHINAAVNQTLLSESIKTISALELNRAELLGMLSHE